MDSDFLSLQVNKYTQATFIKSSSDTFSMINQNQNIGRLTNIFVEKQIKINSGQVLIEKNILDLSNVSLRQEKFFNLCGSICYNIMEEKTSEIKTSKVRGDSLKRSVIY